MKRILLWSALVIALVITIAWPLIPIPSAQRRLASIPASGIDFESKALELSQEDKDFLGKASAIQYLIMMRGGGQFILTIIDGTNNRHAVHDPSYCFSGGGWSIKKMESIKLSSGEANLAFLGKGSEKSEALWFFDDGSHQFTSPIEYWFATSSRRMTLGYSGAEPILVSLRRTSEAHVDWNRVRQIILPSLGFK
jgi:hypothetical protein